MPLVIISRRNITFRENGGGEIVVLLVPSRDQIQVVKDLAGLTNVPSPTRDANSKGVAIGKKQAQLSRVYIGRRYIYGTLPTEISNERQPVKVWLAEDFAPAQSQAFFYIFSKTVVVHGVREQDDEGHQTWRTAQLAVDDADPLRSIINAISDYALANPVDTLTVAVLNKLDLYEKLQAGLATYNISPVPFSKLKPQPSIKPLYRHRDYTILYLTLALFGFITLLASGSYTVLTYLQLTKMEKEVADIQARIDNIKLNQNVGQIADPQNVLKTMGRSINQMPSAIADAAGSMAAEFGRLSTLRVLISPQDADQAQLSPPDPGQLYVLASIEKMNDELLLTQEQQGASVVAGRPWVRAVRRGGSVGDHGDLIITLQIDQAPGTEIPVAPVDTSERGGSPTILPIMTSGTALQPISATAIPVVSPTIGLPNQNNRGGY